MKYLELLLLLRRLRKAFKDSRQIAEVAVDVDLEAIATQAAAYGYEIGRGKALRTVVNTTPDNPFLNKHWRREVVD